MCTKNYINKFRNSGTFVRIQLLQITCDIKKPQPDQNMTDPVEPTSFIQLRYKKGKG